MNPNYIPFVKATIDHIRLNTNLAKQTLDLAVHMSARAMEIGNMPALKALDFLIAKEKYFHERLVTFLNQATGILYTVTQLRDPQTTLNELQVAVKAFDIDMANFYAGSEYQVSWEYLSQVKRAKPVHGQYMQPLPPSS